MIDFVYSTITDEIQGKTDLFINQPSGLVNFPVDDYQLLARLWQVAFGLVLKHF